uniref:Vesicle transport protein n=1 Tax=Meloidogyne hapla TaxID=6305 RepID=A0A1I8BFP0_MELHA
MSLADFVNEQKNKNGNRNYFNVATFGSKVSKSFNGFFKTSDSIDDTERLTNEISSQNGQLPSNRNRRIGWMSFSSSSTSINGQVTADANPCGLNRFQRIAAFFLCLFAAGFCFTTAMMLLPILIIQTRKFAALNTLGSAFFVVRRLVTAIYFISVITTLYTSLWLRSTSLTIIASSFEAFSLIWFLLSYVPGGENGLKWMGRMAKMAFCTKQSSTLVLPI